MFCIIRWFKYEYHPKIYNVISIGMIVVSILTVVVFIAVFQERIFQSSQSFIERIIQILDAGALILSSPLGIGSDA